MVKLEDVKVDDYSISLSKLVGKKIVDIIIVPSYPFSAHDVTAVVQTVVFDDGSMMSFQGEFSR